MGIGGCYLVQEQKQLNIKPQTGEKSNGFPLLRFQNGTSDFDRIFGFVSRNSDDFRFFEDSRGLY